MVVMYTAIDLGHVMTAEINGTRNKMYLGDQQADVGTGHLPDLGNVATPLGTNDANPHVKKKRVTLIIN